MKLVNKAIDEKTVKVNEEFLKTEFQDYWD